MRLILTYTVSHGSGFMKKKKYGKKNCIRKIYFFIKCIFCLFLYLPEFPWTKLILSNLSNAAYRISPLIFFTGIWNIPAKYASSKLNKTPTNLHKHQCGYWAYLSKWFDAMKTNLTTSIMMLLTVTTQDPQWLVVSNPYDWMLRGEITLQYRLNKKPIFIGQVMVLGCFMPCCMTIGWIMSPLRSLVRACARRLKQAWVAIYCQSSFVSNSKRHKIPAVFTPSFF